jgi:hypothetical protein
MRLRPLWYAVLVGLGVALSACATAPRAAHAPTLLTLRSEELARAKARLARGDTVLRPALDRLLSEADSALGAGPFSVTDKKRVPPSGDRHDYISLGPYWWPDSSRAEGLPYVRRDGRRNPETQQDYDSPRFRRMADAVNTLALAYYFAGTKEYARHAATLLRTWFLDPATRMNPNLEYAQAIPGITTGRGFGIIESRTLPRLLDDITLLQGSPSWTARDRQGMQEWMSAFLQWLLTSRNGRDEWAARNNHGSWYDAQTAALALFVGRPELARQILESSKTRRTAVQIKPDGSQPLELARTRSFDYSVFNLEALMQLAELGRKLEVDLWHYEAPGGGSIRKALDYLAPYADPTRKWPGQQITPVDPSRLLLVLRMGELTYRDPRYRALIANIPQQHTRAHRVQLLYPPQEEGVAAAFQGALGQSGTVAPADLSRLSPSDFRDDELDLPYYLAHFHRLANSVALSGERRGFIDLAVWRNPVDNRPHNARIMENILALAFFYATDRPWNPYRGDSAVRARLEAALDFWVRSQSEDGRFSEYAPQRWSLAPTAFATKFMGETLRLLSAGPAIDQELHRRVIAADRRAIMAVLTRTDLYEHGRRFSNQFSNVWAGALAYLALYPDAEIERELRARLAATASEHQSPVGYFYEADGPDWGYNLGTHHSNLHMAWHYARGTDLSNHFIEPTRRWYEWLAYNAVPEPNESGLTLNRSVETRQRRSVVAEAGQQEATGTPLAEHVETARILGPTREELARRRALHRAELQRQWPRVDSLTVGSFRAFSPYAFLHRAHVRWHPTEGQRHAAIAGLRHQVETRFTHQRTDARKTVVFSYVRRPTYYAAFTAGQTSTAQQRYGLGLLWIPQAGSVLQSQTGGLGTAWGTRPADTTLVYEATGFRTAFGVRDSIVALVPGNRDLPRGDYRVEYGLGDKGRKTVVFREHGVHVAVEHAGAFVEQFPLLMLPSDVLKAPPGLVELRRDATRVVLRWTPATNAKVEWTEERSGERRVVSVAIPAAGALTYDLEIHTTRDAR